MPWLSLGIPWAYGSKVRRGHTMACAGPSDKGVPGAYLIGVPGEVLAHLPSFHVPDLRNRQHRTPGKENAANNSWNNKRSIKP